MADYNIKVGDTLPTITATLRNADGTAISLANASGVRFHMRRKGAKELLVGAACTILDAANGRIEYTWQEGDFDSQGTYEGEFQITYTSGDIATVPNDRHFSIQITEEIG